MLEGQTVSSSLDLSRSGHITQLPAEFIQLSESSGSKRVALGDQASRRIHDVLAAVGVVSPLDEEVGCVLLAKSESLVSDQFVG